MYSGCVAAVSGSAGFVGRRLTARLAAHGARVVGLDVTEGADLADWAAVEGTEEFHVFFHLASLVNVGHSFDQPRRYYQTNISTTVNAAELSRLCGARLVLLSSYVYGPPRRLPIDEDHPISGYNPYAQTKIIGEKVCEGYHRDHGLEVCVLRPSNIYGEGQGSGFLIPTIVEQARSGRVRLRDPRPRRDYVHVDDVVQACLLAGRCELAGGFDVFNIGAGVSHSVEEVAELARGHARHPVAVEYGEDEPAVKVPDTCYHIGKAKRLLGWEPEVPLDEGLGRLMS